VPISSFVLLEISLVKADPQRATLLSGGLALWAKLADKRVQLRGRHRQLPLVVLAGSKEYDTMKTKAEVSAQLQPVSVLAALGAGLRPRLHALQRTCFLPRPTRAGFSNPRRPHRQPPANGKIIFSSAW
jgi:hypothetical protein